MTKVTAKCGTCGGATAFEWDSRAVSVCSCDKPKPAGTPEAEPVLLRARAAELERDLIAACEERNRLRLALQDVRGLCRCGCGEARMLVAFAAIYDRCGKELGEG